MAEPHVNDAEPMSVSPASPMELFLAFAGVSMQSFGGAVTFIERMVVQQKRWLGPQEFLGLYAISRVLPGPTGMTFCVLLGERFLGWRGAFAAVAGFAAVPSVVTVGVASLFLRYQHLPQVQGALHGMGAAALGMIFATALRMARTLRGQWFAVAVAVATFCIVGLLRQPVNLVVLTLGLFSVWLAWRGGRP